MSTVEVLTTELSTIQVLTTEASTIEVLTTEASTTKVLTTEVSTIEVLTTENIRYDDHNFNHYFIRIHSLSTVRLKIFFLIVK